MKTFFFKKLLLAVVIFTFQSSFAIDNVERKDKIIMAAVATVVTVNPKNLENKKVSTSSVGSGFSVLKRGQPIWLTASHVVKSVASGNHILLATSSMIQSKRPLLKSLESLTPRDSLSALPQGFSNSHLSPFRKVIVNQKKRYIGNDFSKFQISSVVNDNAIDFSEVFPLPLRNLQENPLELGQELTVYGFNNFKKRKIRCSFRGFSFWLLENKKSSRILMNCQSMPKGKREIGGVSGGAVVDAEGRAVAIFTGALPLVTEKGHLRGVYHAASPVFTHDLGGGVELQPYPAAQVEGSIVLPNCYQHMKSQNDEEFLRNSHLYKRVCIFHTQKSNL